MADRRGLIQTTQFPRTFGSIRGIPAAAAGAGGALPDVTTWGSPDTLDYDELVIAGIVYNDDGTRIYVGSNASGAISKLGHISPDLSPPYVPVDDLSPTSIFSAGSARLREIDWSSDGTKVYAAMFGTGVITEFDNAGTPYNPDSGDLSVSDTFALTPGAPISIYVKPDGTEIYYIANSNGDLYQVTMSAADDLTTAAMGDSFAPAEAFMFAVLFAEDGSNFYMLGIDEVLYEYTCGTPWDITTASYTTRSKDLSAIIVGGATGFGLSMSPDGTKLIVGVSSSSTELNGILYLTI